MLPTEKPKESPKGEHIFPATVVEPLALRWKELIAKGQHAEAAPVLEDIVCKSSQMFARLAQYEGFHHTVDLESLVLAAQARVATWLIYWDPAKGKLFSWLSKSLAGNSMILLADGSTKRIDEIVENKLQVDVVSWDEATRSFVVKPITNWIKYPVDRPPQRRKSASKRDENDLWRLLSVRHPLSKRGQCLFVTGDHEVYTQRGWVEVDYLKPEDKLFQRDTLITAYGKSALVGIYLGDGSINTDGNTTMLGGTHGEKQLEYSKHICERLSRVYSETEGIYSHKGISRPYTVGKFGISLRRSWPEFQQEWLPHKKTVTPWLIDNLDVVALAYWYMDDGHLKWYQKNGRVYSIGLATESFTPEDCYKLIDAIREKFGIECDFYPRNWANYGSIGAAKDQAIKFLDLVAPHIPPCMRQKLPPSHQNVPFKDSAWVSEVATPCQFEVRSVYNSTAARSSSTNKLDLGWRYDITIADTHNFVANGIIAHNCSKHVFLSEVVRTSHYRKRYYPTSDNLEKFVGAEDHAVTTAEAVESVRDVLRDLQARWGDKQVLCCIRFHIACIVENPKGNKKAIIRAGAYASGLSFDLSKFFYNWALYALRDAMYEKLNLPYTEQDLFRLNNSYTYLPDLLTIISWEDMIKMCALLGGLRLKIPTLAQLEQSKQEYKLFRQLERSNHDPESVAKIAKDNHVSAPSAQEIYEKMAHELHDDRSGDFSVY